MVINFNVVDPKYIQKRVVSTGRKKVQRSSKIQSGGTWCCKHGHSPLFFPLSLGTVRTNLPQNKDLGRCRDVAGATILL